MVNVVKFVELIMCLYVCAQIHRPTTEFALA
jgi:hypothetical protein